MEERRILEEKMQEEEKKKEVAGEEREVLNEFSGRRTEDSANNNWTEHVFWDYEDFAGGRGSFGAFRREDSRKSGQSTEDDFYAGGRLQQDERDVENDSREEEGDFVNFRVDTGGIFEEDEEEDELFASLNESLMRQVAEELDGLPNTEQGDEEETVGKKKKGKLKKILTVLGCLVLVLALAAAFLIGTKPGRKIMFNFAAKFIVVNVNQKEPSGVLADLIYPIRRADIENKSDVIINFPSASVTPIPEDAEEIRKEDYVKNILLFGIDQGDMDSVHSSSLNTDTIMIATINTKDKKVKLTSILRDMYVELGDGTGHKINSVYAIGNRNKQGPELLMHTIENYFKIDLIGYAYVKLASFEEVVDILGGVSIELGSKEANYLNTTNYITDPRNRNLKTGVNQMNGNQVAGYCRIRKVETIGGATNDYGRTLRQRRVLQAIFQKYKSQSIMNLIPVTQKCLSKITTNLGEEEISDLLEMFVENGITEMESYRLPLNDSFYDSGKNGYNGITYGLVIDDIEANVVYLYEHLYADTPEEAKENYDALKQ